MSLKTLLHYMCRDAAVADEGLPQLRSSQDVLPRFLADRAGGGVSGHVLVSRAIRYSFTTQRASENVSRLLCDAPDNGCVIN